MVGVLNAGLVNLVSVDFQYAYFCVMYFRISVVDEGAVFQKISSDLPCSTYRNKGNVVIISVLIIWLSL